MHWRAGALSVLPSGIRLIVVQQFAYLQLGTVIATIIRKVELRLEDGITKIPDHNYHVRLLVFDVICDCY